MFSTRFSSLLNNVAFCIWAEGEANTTTGQTFETVYKRIQAFSEQVSSREQKIAIAIANTTIDTGKAKNFYAYRNHFLGKGKDNG